MIELYLLRHGQTPYNADTIRIGGQSNSIPLSAEGERQAEQAGRRIAEQGLRFDRVFCSTALRARRTLELVMSQATITDSEVVFSDRILELCQGDWEGQLRDLIYTPQRLAEMDARVPHFKAPNGESQHEVEERMMSFVNDNIVDRYTEGCFLIVGHGISFRCLLRGILGSDPRMTYKIGIDNASLTRLRYEPSRGWRVDYINRI